MNMYVYLTSEKPEYQNVMPRLPRPPAARGSPAHKITATRNTHCNTHYNHCNTRYNIPQQTATHCNKITKKVFRPQKEVPLIKGSAVVQMCGIVCYSALRCFAVCCSGETFLLSLKRHASVTATVLAVCCSLLLQCIAVCCSVLQCIAVCCSLLQCIAVCCSVLQSVAVCCSVLQCIAVCCSLLQCSAVCCSLLQSVAVCCSLLSLLHASAATTDRWFSRAAHKALRCVIEGRAQKAHSNLTRKMLSVNWEVATGLNELINFFLQVATG